MNQAKFIAAAFLVSVLASSAWAEALKELDRREDSESSGLYVGFCNKPTEKGSSQGHAFSFLAKGKGANELTIEAAFGLYEGKDGPTLVSLKSETVTAVRKQKSLPETVTLLVQVSKEHYEAAEVILKKWMAKTSFLDEPDIEALNCTSEVIVAIKLKAPFRPMLSRANPHAYHQDLIKLNREK